MSDRDDGFEYETYGPADNQSLGAADVLDEFDQARDALRLQLDQQKQKNSRVFIVRTSDRITRRRCRRKWSWSNAMKRNLQSSAASAPLWLGTGLHYAFEDYHGYRKFERPRDSLDAYLQACEKAGSPIPEGVDELLHLGKGMMDYYENWLEWRDPLQTFIVDGEPQVEVSFYIEIPKEHLARYLKDPCILDEYDQILYSMTIDRITIDNYGRLWNVEYKSAKSYLWAHLETDQQVTSYHWGSHIKYPGYEIAGTIYQQHKKQLLQPPKFLASSKMFSTSKRQKTSVALYVGALRNLYGNDQRRWPEENQAFLEYLKTKETGESDELIRRDFVERNNNQMQAEYQKVLWETAEMLDPDQFIYPNPTRDCTWDCPFKTPCVGIDSGEDFEGELQAVTMRRDAPETLWRDHLRVS